MVYKIYYANSLKSTGPSGTGTGGRFKSYDHKTYRTKEEAKEQLEKDRKRFSSIDKYMKKKGIKEKYEIRSAGGNRERRTSQPSMFGSSQGSSFGGSSFGGFGSGGKMESAFSGFGSSGKKKKRNMFDF